MSFWLCFRFFNFHHAIEWIKIKFLLTGNYYVHKLLLIQLLVVFFISRFIFFQYPLPRRRRGKFFKVEINRLVIVERVFLTAGRGKTISERAEIKRNESCEKIFGKQEFTRDSLFYIINKERNKLKMCSSLCLLDGMSFNLLFVEGRRRWREKGTISV